jgi:hypothetical protein
MAILIFILSFVLLAAGAASAYQSLDLLPTGIGVLYALSAAVGVAAAVVTFAIGVAIRRIDALTKLVKQSAAPAVLDATPARIEAAPAVEAAPAAEAVTQPVTVERDTPAPESVDEPFPVKDESPININRAGHLPSLEAIESVLETPESPPSLIGSYSSAGANYRIFADGSIEAETSEGTFRFASMSDFKRHIVEAKTQTAPEVE